MRQGRLSSIAWTVEAKRSFRELMTYLRSQSYGDADRAAREISLAIHRLRRFPELCAIQHHRRGKDFRRLVVNGRFSVYYIYFKSEVPSPRGRISIRAVRHCALKRPFAGVREEGASTTSMSSGMWVTCESGSL